MKKTIAFLLSLVLFLSLLSVPAAAESLSAIVLTDNGAESVPTGVVVDGSVVRIMKSGEYIISGSMSNGCLSIECERGSKVKVYLNGVTIHNETGPAIYVDKGMGRASISLMENTENILSNGKSLSLAGEDHIGVIFSRSDLTITGEGSLTITAGSDDGVVSKDDLRVKGGIITVTAPRHGIRGKDYIEISEAEVTVNAGKDALRTTESDGRDDRGYISLLDATVNLNCSDDAFVYTTRLIITNTTVNCLATEEYEE